MQKITFKYTLTMLLILASMLIFARGAVKAETSPQQPNGPVLKLSPETYNYKGGSLPIFNMNVTIVNLDPYWDLAGFDIILTFNKTFIKALNITEGPFIETYNFTYIIKREINNTEGYVWLAYMQLMPPEERPTPYGNWTLFTITFSAEMYCQQKIKFITEMPRGLAGFPHPERSEPPYNNSESAVPIPYTAEDANINVIELKQHVLTVDNVNYTVVTESNSTVSTPTVNAPIPALMFTTSGLDGTVGYCNVTVPKNFMWTATVGDWMVLVDGQQVQPQISEDNVNTYIYLTYNQSTHYITIITTSIVPEFSNIPSMLIILLLSATALIAFKTKKNI
jgi:hypothetical protein